MPLLLTGILPGLQSLGRPGCLVHRHDDADINRSSIPIALRFLVRDRLFIAKPLKLMPQVGSNSVPIESATVPPNSDYSVAITLDGANVHPRLLMQPFLQFLVVIRKLSKLRLNNIIHRQEATDHKMPQVMPVAEDKDK
jgi:hypothetical protein